MLYFSIYLDTSVGWNVIQAIFSSECPSEMFSCTMQTLKTVHGKSCMNLVLKCCTSCEYLMLGISVERDVEIGLLHPPPPLNFKEQAPWANESNRSLKVFGRTSGLARNWPLFFSQTGRITASLVTRLSPATLRCKKVDMGRSRHLNMLSSQGKLTSLLICADSRGKTSSSTTCC